MVQAAVVLADEQGIEPLTMRTLGEAVGVRAMSLYNHVDNKDDLLDGMVDAVFAEIELPSGVEGWKAAMRRREIEVRAALSRPPLGHRPDGVADLTWARDAAAPRRRHRLFAGCRVLRHDFGHEYEFGLDLILDGLERVVATGCCRSRKTRRMVNGC